jgi:uncharacterized protein YjdB
MRKCIHSLAAVLAALALSVSFVACPGDDDPADKPAAAVAVSSIALSRNAMTLAAGDATGVLAAALAPADATDKGVRWDSDDKTIATVSQGGVVTPMAAGRATITATSNDGGKVAKCSLEVVAAPIPAVAAAPNKYATTIAPGGKEAFIVTFYPDNATNQNLSWRSSDASIAEVSATGEVTAKKPGTVTITATPAQAMPGAAPIQVLGGPAPIVGDGDGGMDMTVTVPATPVAVTGVKLNKSAVSLTVGNTETLIATVQPENATNQAVNWISSEPSVAVVSSGGTVTALSPGTAVVVVATVDGGRMTTCTVIVSPAPAAPKHPTGVTLDPTEVTIPVGGTVLLEPTVIPSDATNKNLYWQTDTPGVAVVSSLGLVTAVAPGSATITVATIDGGKTATCDITVTTAPVAVTAVTLSKSSMALGVGGSERLLETVLPDNATNKAVSWSSNNTGVATVDNGLVTGMADGTATITVTANDTTNGTKTATCAVTVTTAAVPVTGVTLSPATMGLTVGGAGQSLMATVAPADATNKSVTWSVEPNGVVSIAGTGATVTVSPVAAGTATITVTANDTTNGTKTATCAVTVAPPAATGVTLDRRDMSLALGESEPIVATVLPEDAANKAVTWATNNPGIATVSAAGVVTATGRGTATITATTVDGGHTASCDVTLVNVYAPGTADESIALLKNGALLPVEIMELPPSNYLVYGYDVSHAFVTDGGDVYASSLVGTILREYDPGQGRWLYVQCITVWKNGLIHQIMRNEGYDGYRQNLPGGVMFQAECLFVSDNDVYLAGVGVERNPQSYRPMLWKNGVSQSLALFNAGTGQPWGTSVFVSGGDVYMVGRDLRTEPQPTNLATLWKNGAATYLNEGGGNALGMSVYVSGGDVYVGGAESFEGHSRATVWKNGVAQRYAIPEGSLNESVSSLFVVGDDVYAAGHCYYTTGAPPYKMGALLWKNGALQHLSPPDGSGSASSVYVFGDDVYVFGDETVDGVDVPTLWKNGVPKRLPNGYDSGRDKEIAVSRVTQGVTDVSLDKATATVFAGYDEWLSAIVQPYNAPNAATWSSSNNSVATVSNGVVTGVALGSATITATTIDGNKTATCQMTVLPPVNVIGVAVDPASYGIVVGDYFYIGSYVEPDDATNQNVAWTSSDPGVASITNVYSNGYLRDGVECRVSGVSPGTATITATTQDGGKTASCVVYVASEAVPLTGITLDKTAVSLGTGDTETLTATLHPHDTTAGRYISWGSSDYSVVSIQYGGYDTANTIITATGPGTATITARTQDGAFAATCAVTVSFLPGDGPVVYVAGYQWDFETQTTVATLWTSGGAPVSLNAAGSREATALSVAVSATNDVYVAGNGYSVDNEPVAILWENGEPIRLGTDYSLAESVFVSDIGDVYVAGFGNANGWWGAILWKNGVAQFLSQEQWWDALSVYVSAGDVYVAGYAYGPEAVLWKNGVVTHLPSAVGTDWNAATSVYVSATDDVYVAGYGNIDEEYLVAVLWKNGVPVRLGTNYSEAYSVFVSSAGDVYVAGYEYVNDEYLVATLWKNGETIRLSADYSYARSVFVSDTGDVYVAGYGNANGRWGATLWKNGTPMPLGDGYAYSVCVTREMVPVTGVTLSPSLLNLDTGYTGTIAATIAPANASVKALSWTSDNAAVATVTPTGTTATVTGVSAGSTTITATSPDGPSASVTVVVANVPVTGVSLTPADLTLGMGRTRALTAAVTPAAATNKNVTWQSSSPGVVTVVGNGQVGSVTGVGLGTATITVTTEDGNKTATCAVTVLEAVDHEIYVAGHFGVYKDGGLDARFPTDQRIMDIFVDAEGSVHAVGTFLDPGSTEWEAAHWKNGARTVLEKGYIENTAGAGANAMFVDGFDVYIAGFEAFYHDGERCELQRLWKNGQRYQLEGHTYYTHIPMAAATSVRVHNGDVYAAGYSNQVDGWQRPVIWKNGAQHLNQAMEDYQILDFGVASNGIIYALCENEWAKLWGVAPFTVWVVQPDLTTWALAFSLWDTSGLNGWIDAPHLFVEGNDCYAVGYIDYDAYCWKNGESIMLEHPAGAYWVEADDIFVLDGDVYIAGCATGDEDQSSYSLVLWKNGAVVLDAIPATLPGGGQTQYEYARVRGLFVK